MGDQAWTASASDLLEIQFMEWVDSYEASGLIPGALAFYGDEEVTAEHKEALVSVVKDLHQRGLIDGNRRLGGWSTFGASLTPPGRRLLGERRERRESRRARSIAARDALLDWLYENSHEAGESAEIEQFSGSVHAHVEGDAFSADEITAAAQFLVEEEYLKGIGAWGGPVVIRPSLTPKGRRAVESGLYTTEPPQIGSTHNTLNVHGHNYGQAAAGQSVTQQQTVGADPGHLADLIDAVRDALSGLDQNDVSGAEAYLTMIEATAPSEEPNRGVIEVAGRGLLNLADKATDAITGASIRTLWMYLADRYGFPAG